ncbi:hypothetical protein [Dokdonia sp.]|uniref:hypothetical protein n=1 Tax=Dokdonia sp. TaxID=2024995 RepID=UPI0032656C35
MKKLTLLIVLLTISIAATTAQTNVFPDDGNVGIGTTAPVQELDVNGTTRTNQLIVGDAATIPSFANAWLEGGFSSQLFFNTTSSPVDERVWAMSAINGDFKIFAENDNLSALQEAFVINRGTGINIENVLFPNGNVGIGTSSFVDGNDTYRFSVNGKIRAHGVKVYTTWADYVFENDYDLKSLEEVEDFIKQNGHLPNVPSEAEVLENGIELGAMNAKLLEKIEELTLYIIELNKKIEELETKID